MNPIDAGCLCPGCMALRSEIEADPPLMSIEEYTFWLRRPGWTKATGRTTAERQFLRYHGSHASHTPSESTLASQETGRIPISVLEDDPQEVSA